MRVRGILGCDFRHKWGFGRKVDRVRFLRKHVSGHHGDDEVGQAHTRTALWAPLRFLGGHAEPEDVMRVSR